MFIFTHLGHSGTDTAMVYDYKFKWNTFVFALSFGAENCNAEITNQANIQIERAREWKRTEKGHNNNNNRDLSHRLDRESYKQMGIGCNSCLHQSAAELNYPSSFTCSLTHLLRLRLRLRIDIKEREKRVKDEKHTGAQKQNRFRFRFRFVEQIWSVVNANLLISRLVPFTVCAWTSS